MGLLSGKKYKGTNKIIVASKLSYKTPETENKEQAIVKQTAEGFAKKSEDHLQRHVTLARCITLLQAAIAIAAISIITRRRFMSYINMATAIIGLYFFIMGMR